MSKNKLLIIVLMLTVMLTGCFPSGELNPSSDPAVDSGNGESIIPEAPAELENAKFDITLSNDYPSEVPIIKATLHTFDAEETEKLKALFIGGKTLIDDLPPALSGSFVTADGARLTVRENHFTFSVNHMYDGENEKNLIYDMQDTAVINVKDWKKFFPHIYSELEDFPRSEALLRANELVEQVGLKCLDEPIIYAFTEEDVESFADDLYNNGDLVPEDREDFSVFSKEDEFYLVRYLTAYNGIPIPIESNPIFGEVSPEFTKIDVMLTKDELIGFSCLNPFDKIEEVGTTQIKFGAEAALSKFYEYFSLKDAVMKYQVKYDDLGLAYMTYEADMASGEYTYKPVWYMTGDFNVIDTPDNVRFTDKFADPVTGLVFDTVE